MPPKVKSTGRKVGGQKTAPTQSQSNSSIGSQQSFQKGKTQNVTKLNKALPKATASAPKPKGALNGANSKGATSTKSKPAVPSAPPPRPSESVIPPQPEPQKPADTRISIPSTNPVDKESLDSKTNKKKKGNDSDGEGETPRGKRLRTITSTKILPIMRGVTRMRLQQVRSEIIPEDSSNSKNVVWTGICCAVTIIAFLIITVVMVEWLTVT